MSQNDLLQLEELKKQNKSLQSKLELLKVQSWQFRVHLSSIISHTIMLQETELSNEQYELLTTVRESSIDLHRFVINFSDFLNLESDAHHIEKEQFMLTDCLENVCDLLKKQVNRKSIDLTYTIDKDVPSIVIGDKKSIYIILSHLIDNAVRLSSIEGKISISILLAQKGKALKFIIRDNGIGISDHYLELVQRFFAQSKPIVIPDVCGFGFSISKILCDALLGTIQIESVREKGTIIDLTIPFGFD